MLLVLAHRTTVDNMMGTMHRRFFVLIPGDDGQQQQQQQGPDDKLLVYFEKADATAGCRARKVILLRAGEYTISMPKKARRGYPHCLRIDSSSAETAVYKCVVAAASAAELAGWLEILRPQGTPTDTPTVADHTSNMQLESLSLPHEGTPPSTSTTGA